MRPVAVRMLSGATVLVALVALAGCTATGAPSASPTASDPSPSPSVDLGPAAVIQISATDVSVLDAEGDVIGTHDFLGDAPGMVDLLENAIGEAPEVVAPSDDSCSTDTHYTWGDGFEFWISETAEAPAAPFTPLHVASKVDAIGSVQIVTSTGFRVGDDATEVIAGLPADQVNDAIQIIWERTGTVDGPDGPAPFGGYAFVDYDTKVVTSISAPGTFGSGYC